MPEASETIYQLIEESYLLGLSEQEIRTDLDRFVEVCGKVIREHVHDRKQMQELAQKLAQTRALSLIEDQHQDDDGGPVEYDEDRPVRERFAERVARNKCLILKTIRDCNPKLEELIERERYPSLAQEPESPLPFNGGPKPTAKDMVFKVFYVLTLMFVLLLVYLVLLQQNF